MCIKADLSQESRSAGKLRQKMTCHRRVHHTITSPGEFPPYAGNMLWRTVAVLPLADRHWQPYASSRNNRSVNRSRRCAAPSLCTQNRIMNPVAAHKDELNKLLENLSGDTAVPGITFVASLDAYIARLDTNCSDISARVSP